MHAHRTYIRFEMTSRIVCSRSSVFVQPPETICVTLLFFVLAIAIGGFIEPNVKINNDDNDCDDHNDHDHDDDDDKCVVVVFIQIDME